MKTHQPKPRNSPHADMQAEYDFSKGVRGKYAARVVSSQTMNVHREEGFAALRVWRRQGTAKRSPRLLIKCGDCQQSVAIFHDNETLEINGVLGSLENWREILLPLLNPKSTK